MALKEETVIDQITILEDGQIQVRRADKVFREDVEIAKAYHRHVLVPGDDLSGQAARVRAVAEVVHTPEVIAAYLASLPAPQEPSNGDGDAQ